MPEVGGEVGLSHVPAPMPVRTDNQKSAVAFVRRQRSILGWMSFVPPT